MRWIALAVVSAALMVNGQAAKPHSDADKRHSASKSTDATDTAGQTVVVVNQQAPQRQENDHPGKPPSYLHELLVAANLPNLLLVGVGIGGIIIAVCTLKHISRQTTLLGEYVAATKQMAVGSLRPRLEVKHVFLIPDETITGKPGDGKPGDGHDWCIGCVIANVGGSKAEVIDSDVNIPNLGIGTLESRIPPNSMPYYAKHHSFGTFVVDPGVRQTQTVILDANSEEVRHLRIAHVNAERREQTGERFSDTSPIICFGYFRYKDESGIERLTGFGWEWNKRDMSFTRLNHPNYEYTD